MMFFNLLLIFLMGIQSEPPKDIILQPVTTQSWYTQRPINARTQTYNRYLDSVIAIDSTRAIATSSLTTIPWYVYTVTGKYNRAKTTWQVLIPTDWTYQLNVIWFFAADATATGIRFIVINLNWSPLEIKYVLPIASVTMLIDITEIFNLNKNDYITVDVYQSSWWPLNVTTKLKAFKLS